MKRLFTAIEIPDSIKEYIKGFYARFPGAGWAKTAQLHLTLRFMGDTDDDKIPFIIKNLQSVNWKSFEVRIGGTGFFPPKGRPRVFWIGIDADTELNSLKYKIDTELEKSDFPPEEREFKPHLTLCRIKKEKASSAYRDKLAAVFSEFREKSFTVNEFHLYESRLLAQGAEHIRLSEFKSV